MNPLVPGSKNKRRCRNFSGLPRRERQHRRARKLEYRAQTLSRLLRAARHRAEGPHCIQLSVPRALCRPSAKACRIAANVINVAN